MLKYLQPDLVFLEEVRNSLEASPSLHDFITHLDEETLDRLHGYSRCVFSQAMSEEQEKTIQGITFLEVARWALTKDSNLDLNPDDNSVALAEVCKIMMFILEAESLRRKNLVETHPAGRWQFRVKGNEIDMKMFLRVTDFGEFTRDSKDRHVFCHLNRLARMTVGRSMFQDTHDCKH